MARYPSITLDRQPTCWLQIYCPDLFSETPQQQWSIHNKATDIVRVARDHKICMLIYKFAYKLKKFSLREFNKPLCLISVVMLDI